MRLFGSEKLMGIFKSIGVAKTASRSNTRCFQSQSRKHRRRSRANNFGIRKNLLEYDQVNNEQREIIYKERRRVLDGESMRDSIFQMITDIVENTGEMCISSDQDTQEEWDLRQL